MKKPLKTLLAVTVITATIFLSGCDKPGQEQEQTFSREYLFEFGCHYAEVTVKDREAVAIPADDGNTTYGDIESAMPEYVGAFGMDTQRLILNPDGTVIIKIYNYVIVEETIFPNIEAGLTPESIKYTVKGDKLIFNVGSAVVEAFLDDLQVKDRQEVKNRAEGFNKGLFVYHLADNSVTLTCKFRESGDDVRLYWDKDLLYGTWLCTFSIKKDLLYTLGGNEQSSYPDIINGVLSKGFLDGFDTLAIGSKGRIEKR